MNLVELSPKKRVTYWGLFRGQNDVTEESKIVKPTIEDDDDDSTNNGPSENETERIKDTDTLLSKLANVDPKFAAFNEVVVLILACASVRYHLIQSYIGEIIKGVPLYYTSWLKVPKERKEVLITDIGTQFDLRPHMESPDWTEINADIKQHLQKAYNTNKAAFKAHHWVIDPTTGTYNVEKIRRAPQNRQNRAKSKVISRQGSRSLARLRDEMRQSSTTQEYPSLIDTFFVAHTVNEEFLKMRTNEEMRRLEAMGIYTDDEINRLARGGKQQRHIPGVGRVLPARATTSPSTPVHESTLNSLHKKVDFMMSLFKSDSKHSDMFSQFESGGASGSGGCGDDEEGADDHDDEDEDGDGDT
nr:F-box domain, leucine-rich repeat domain, L domain-like protein [Tanacetum cinerariifolium]